MRRLLWIVCLFAVSPLIFSPPVRADGVHSFTYRADSDFDNLHFADANCASVDGHSGFFESRTFGFNEDNVNWLGDPDDDHGKAWGWHKHHHHDGGVDGNSGDGDSWGNGGDNGNTGSGNGDPSTPSVPEPSVLVLLSTAIAVFFLKSLRRATA